MDDTIPERWLPIPGYEGYYDASDHGRIRSLPDKRRFVPPVVRVLKPWIKPAGHQQVVLSVNGRGKSYDVHRLIALTFIGPPPSPRHEICHNDGDPTNNRPGNLRWGTRSDNIYDSVRHGVNYWANRTHCAQGHPFSPENTRIVNRPGGKTARICITCRRAVVRKSDRKRRSRQRSEGKESAS